MCCVVDVRKLSYRVTMRARRTVSGFGAVVGALLMLTASLALGCQKEERSRGSDETPNDTRGTRTLTTNTPPQPEPKAPVRLEQYAIRVEHSALPCVAMEYDQRFDVPYTTLTLRGTNAPAECDLSNAAGPLAAMLTTVQQHMNPSGANPIVIHEVEILNADGRLLPGLAAYKTKRRTRLCDAAHEAGLDETLEQLVKGKIAELECAHGHAGGKDWVGEGNAKIDRLVYRAKPEPSTRGAPPTELARRLPLRNPVATPGEPTVRIARFAIGADDHAACVSVEYSYSLLDLRDQQTEDPRGRITIRRPWDCGPSDLGKTEAARNLLRGIQALAGPTLRVDGASLYWLGPRFYERLARAAAGSPEWDGRKGRAKKAERFDVGTTYDLVCKIANEAHAHVSLSEALEGIASNVRCEGLEKLSVLPVSELPFGDALVASGVPASTIVPYTAAYYFSAEPL